jgi:hypothetical protein
MITANTAAPDNVYGRFEGILVMLKLSRQGALSPSSKRISLPLGSVAGLSYRHVPSFVPLPGDLPKRDTEEIWFICCLS